MSDFYKRHRAISTIVEFTVYFCFTSFVVSCSFILFLHGINLDEAVIRARAPVTFLNVFVLSAILTLSDVVRGHFLVDVPVQRILDATRRVTKGDFSVRNHNHRHSRWFDVCPVRACYWRQ